MFILMIIDLNVEGKNIIVIGGGEEGTRKIRALLGQNCNITLISDNINDYLSSLVKEGKISFIQRHINDANILDEINIKPFMVLATTDDKALNRMIIEKAKSMNAFAYAADDPEVSDFIHPAVINIEGVLFIAISTKGASPAMARVLRMKIEEMIKSIISKDDLEMIKLTNFARTKSITKLKTVEERKKYLYTIINDAKINEMIRNNKLDEAKREVIEILERWQ